MNVDSYRDCRRYGYHDEENGGFHSVGLLPAAQRRWNANAERLSLLSFLRALKSGGVGYLPLANSDPTSNESSVPRSSSRSRALLL